jgi:riboflavin kinase / FMN adenylyltransferase
MSVVVVHSPEEWLARFGGGPGSVITIGNFDGVHVGHQKIIAAVVRESQREKTIAGAVTFDPHPLRVLRPNDAPSLLMSLDQRLEAMSALGLAAVLVLRFDHALSLLSPKDFIESIVVNKLQARSVLVGGNFRFGHRGAGTVENLRNFGREFRFRVEAIDPVCIRGQVVSSTLVRNAVREGNVAWAGRLLGGPFSLRGEIRTGTGQGRRLIVPTLNLATDQEVLPKTGVYVTQTRVNGQLYRSATNVGMRPTFNGHRLTIESHLFDFAEELTSGNMEVFFCHRLREEKKFTGPDALREQVLKDLNRARRFFRLAGRRPTASRDAR